MVRSFVFNHRKRLILKNNFCVFVIYFLLTFSCDFLTPADGCAAAEEYGVGSRRRMEASCLTQLCVGVMLLLSVNFSANGNLCNLNMKANVMKMNIDTIAVRNQESRFFHCSVQQFVVQLEES